MNLFQIATRGIDLDSAPITPDDESPREGFRFEEPAQPQQRLRLPAELDEVFALAAQEYEIDPDVLRGIAYAESRFNPDIISGKVKSKVNAAGNYTTAAGMQALYYNTTGSSNTAAGMRALYANTTGSYNTAAGMYALYANTTGNYNTAAGV